MSKKVYIKPPEMTRIMMIFQIVLGILFLPFGVMFVFIVGDDARPFVAMFALIWVVVCSGIIVFGVNGLKLIKQGKFQIAEIDDEEKK